MIVRTGPYRFSRKPIYLALSLFQLGIAIWVNSLGLLGALVGAVALILYVVELGGLISVGAFYATTLSWDQPPHPQPRSE